ncbi:30S ribosomal protein S17 [Candidatus Kaiserbacteria bacterium CG10_big_fil_rev_8_21_14_0_10_45_20]|uniref:30S ribosomal protein S17 n=1 Tax=Candidatus Kaiserbacteria bacterium CG10_big_fil_rev_8_21_14_0_10_45_20 TaxID=1974607 RepID=A0A2H0UFJ2_9BACT|nr:MAG: 30S ribosomal protein S17 [Candidatus Kaiserbacteria bacterium CG10_big_fil_rev_8_21_14_0_10_45_20]
MTDQTPTKTSKPKTLRGVVTSAKMKDTVTVSVTRFVKDPKYKKYATVSKKYLAHDPGNTKAEGDKVTIEECRPLSKRKSFKVI